MEESILILLLNFFMKHWITTLIVAFVIILVISFVTDIMFGAYSSHSGKHRQYIGPWQRRRNATKKRNV